MNKTVKTVFERIEEADKAKREKAKALQSKLQESVKRANELSEAIEKTEDPEEYTKLISEREEANRQIEYFTKACGEKPKPAINKEEYTALYEKLVKEIDILQTERAPEIIEALKKLTALVNDYAIEHEEIDKVSRYLGTNSGIYHSVKPCGAISEKAPEESQKILEAFMNSYYLNVETFRSFKE